MANAIQAIRNVYDVVKAAKDKGTPLTDDVICMLLENTVDNTALVNKYKRFENGYAAEDLFMRIYSLLPWVRLITPLGQEQFPDKSKEEFQVSDYEIIYEVGDKEHIGCVLVEVKLIDGDKETNEIKKYQHEVLKNYAEKKQEDILYALFWRKYGVWTLVPIEAYNEKSSVYKIQFAKAYENDLSAIFGDYTYFFQNIVYRKSKCTKDEKIKTEYLHIHEKYGRFLYEGLSANNVDYEKICFVETPVLDCAFDFKVNKVDVSGNFAELIEEIENLPYIYRLSNLLLKYLLKIYCYNPSDMYCHDNYVVDRSFDIVDTVRRKCRAEKYYLLPKRTATGDRLFQVQFGKANHIYEAYKHSNQETGLSFVSHD